jgi:hypothetical protein
MALVNMIVKSTKAINWGSFLKDYSSLNFSNIEIFPIPKELGFDCDCIGVNVHQGYANKKIVIAEIERFITFFINKPYAFKFIELYDGLEVIPENVIVLIDKLLPA